MAFKEDYQQTCRAVLDELEKALSSIDPDSVQRLTADILRADQVFFVGVGRVIDRKSVV